MDIGCDDFYYANGKDGGEPHLMLDKNYVAARLTNFLGGYDEMMEVIKILWEMHKKKYLHLILVD